MRGRYASTVIPQRGAIMAPDFCPEPRGIIKRSPMDWTGYIRSHGNHGD